MEAYIPELVNKKGLCFIESKNVLLSAIKVKNSTFF
jgi:hypothetical protein